MCRITSVSGRSADQPRVPFGHVRPCQTHQWFCFRVSHSYLVTSRTLVSSRRLFFFWRAALRFCCSKKSHTRARRSEGVAQVGAHILTPYGWCYGREQMVFGQQQIRVACLQVCRTRNGCGLLLCRIDRSDRQHSKNLRHVRADWRLHIRGVELMQVGTVRMSQHRVTLTGPMHSGDNDDQAFLLSDGRDANLCYV